MAVTSSAFTLDPVTQADGSKWCEEVHTVTGGDKVRFLYLSPAGTDNAGIMAARVAQVNTQIAESEASGNMEFDGALTLRHQTAAQFATRLRAAYRASSRTDTCRLAWWLLRRIAAGHVTDAQCQSAFGMTASAWTNFKTNTLTPQSNAWAAVLAATGA